MKTSPSAAGEFRGRHMLAIMLAFFGVIVAVNVTMAVLANTSWTGFVVKNSHVAGREFNRKAEEGRRQAALGWTARLTISEGMVRYALADAGGAPVRPAGGTATFRRPVSDAEDTVVTLAPRDGVLEGAVVVGDGAWIVELLVDAGLDTPWRETRRLSLRDGALR